MQFKDYPVGWNLIKHDSKLLERCEHRATVLPLQNVTDSGKANVSVPPVMHH